MVTVRESVSPRLRICTNPYPFHTQDLARKLIALFTLSRELLSPQQHYDWGLRALKTSLGIAGRELREVRGTRTEGE